MAGPRGKELRIPKRDPPLPYAGSLLEDFQQEFENSFVDIDRWIAQRVADRNEPEGIER